MLTSKNTGPNKKYSWIKYQTFAQCKSSSAAKLRISFSKLVQIIYVYLLQYQKILKLYTVQCSTVQNRWRSAVHYIAVHFKSAICYTVKFNAVQEIELLCIETIYIFKKFQWSALHIKEVQCNSMDSNIDQCSAVECTAAHPCLTKSPQKRRKILVFVFFLYRCFY